MELDSIETDSCLLKLKVTCVKFIGNFIYAGIGGNLLLFEAGNISYKLCDEVKDLLPNNIYGIQPDDGNRNVAIYGNKKLTVISCGTGKLSRSSIWEAKQWILCVQWLNVEYLAIVTGLNEVDLLNWTTKTVEKTAVCEEKCILYSAHLVGCKWAELIVLAGTVYREILVWAPSKAEKSSISVIHRLRGHDGVIFSVTYDHVTRRICSTSDDRSVRVWNVVHPELCSKLSLDQWIGSSIEAHVTIYGHRARVWRGSLLHDGRIVSIGEDSLLCIWDKTGKNLLKQETHQGGRLCCLDIDEHNDVAITGGADGGIKLWSMDAGLNEVIKTDLPDQEPARLLVLGSGSVVVVYRTGCLIECAERSLIFEDSRFVNYCLSEASNCGGFVALGSIEGDILILEDRIKTEGKIKLLSEKKLFDGKIFSLQWLDENHIVCCGPEGKLSVCKLNKEDDAITLKPVEHFLLPPCRERWTTCAVLHHTILICGTRNGSLHVYQMGTNNQNPLQSFHKIHGCLGVTSLVCSGHYLWSTGRDGTMRRFFMNKATNAIDQLFVDRLPFTWVAKVIETELAGTLVIGFHEVWFMVDAVGIQLDNDLSTEKSWYSANGFKSNKENTEKQYFTVKDKLSDPLIKSKDVVVWSQKSRVIIWRLNCCGGHREWKCFVKNNLLHLYFIKDRTIHLIKKPLEQIFAPSLLDGFHTREINSLEMLPITDSITLLASGGEDNTVRISFLKSGRSLIHTVVLSGHLSSVRTVAVLPLQEKNKILLFSAGGRAQMKVWLLQFDINSEGEPAIVKSVELASHMINDAYDTRKSLKNVLPRLDPETRYMDISVLENTLNKGHYLVYSACSDGFMRIFDFSLKDNQFTLVSSTSHQRCLLKTGLLKHKNEVLPFTTTTNGQICVWHAVGETQVINHRVFESGVNCCDIFKMADNKFLIASGGDNCRVAIDLIDLSCQSTIVRLWSSGELHFSQVSGIKFEDNFLFTVGVDQRLNILNWSMSKDNSFQVVYQRQYCSYVPDIHGLGVIRRSKNAYTVCIYGVGIEIVQVSEQL